MKKYLYIIVPFISLAMFGQAPQLQTEISQINLSNASSKMTPADEGVSHRPAATVNDTLEYFFNKHFFRNSTVANANLSFPTIKSPYQTSSVTISHCGAVFLNSSNIAISGLTGLVSKPLVTTSQAVPFKLYLCNVNAQLLPVFPPLDSCVATVSNTLGVWRGGTFISPVNVSSNFAVLFKIGSPLSGDTIKMFMTNAHTATSTASGITAAQKYGEGLGVLRFNGNFQSNTNAFSPLGTDYEFIVAPYVTYSFNSLVSTNTPTICSNSIGSFSNVSTPMPLIESRFFNFNKFKPYWAPTNTVMPTVTDSIYNWTFTGSSTPPQTTKHANAFFTTVGNQSATLVVKIKNSSLSTNHTSTGSGTINVSNAGAPTLSVAGQTVFCSNTPVTTTLTVTGASSYTWTSPTTVTDQLVVTTGGTVTYTVSSGLAGCIALKTVTVTVKPVPGVTLTAGVTQLCNTAGGGSTVTLTGAPNGGFYSGSNVSGNKFTPATAGTFEVVYSYTNSATSCSNSASVEMKVIDCTGIPTVSSTENITVFPNPAVTGRFVIKNLTGTNKVELFSLLGSRVMVKNCDTEECLVDISDLPLGHYFVKVTDTKGLSKTVKIVNQN